ncbi:MAG: hypothetical protein KGY78_05020 [Anaerolineae bacterium]|nr:hypothetical protein [Anaerolineae bacterium]
MSDPSVSTVSDEAMSAQAKASKAAARRAAMAVIMATNFLLNFGYQIWRSLFNNFAIDELGVQANQMGAIQSVREIPGLLGFTVGLLAMLLTEMRTAGLSIVLLGLGIALTGGATDLPSLLVSTVLMTALYLVNNLVGAFLYRQLGRIIARVGEKRALTVNFVLLIFVFLGYAYIPVLPVLYILFVADHMLFGFRIALQSYFQKIAVHRREITPNLSLGQTINHVASVIIPLVGGIIWETVGSHYTFLVGVGVVVFALILVQWMRVEPGAVSQATAAGS